MEQIAWATSIFEGEGWIKKDKRKRATFELCVQMSDLDIIQRLQQVFQTGSVYKGTTPKNPNHKQLYRWSGNALPARSAPDRRALGCGDML